MTLRKTRCNEREFESVEEVGRVEHPYAMPYETNQPIHVARGLKVPLPIAWPRTKSARYCWPTRGPFGPLADNGPSKVPFTCQDASSTKMPVLIVEGGKTGRGPRVIDSVLLGCLPDARRAVLPDAGHTIQYDAPEEMARVVAGFLAR